MRKTLRQRWKEKVPWGWRWAIWAVVVVGGFYTIENIRGEFAIRQYEKRCAEAGEWLVHPKRDGFNLAALLQAAGHNERGLYANNLDHFDMDIYGTQHPYGFQAVKCYPFDQSIQRSGNWTNQSAAHEYLKIHSGPIQEFKEIIDQADFLLTWSDDLEDKSPSIIDGPPYLYFSASAKIATNKNQHAITDIQSAIKLRQLLYRDGTLLEFLAAQRANICIADSIWEMLDNNVLNQAQIQSLSEDFSKIETAPTLPLRIYATERYLTWTNRQDFFTLRGRISKKPVYDLHNQLTIPGWSEDYVDLAKYILRFTPNGWHKLWWIKSQEDFRALNWSHSKRLDHGWYFRIWHRYQSYDLSSVAASCAPATAALRLCRIALALELYHLDHSSYPAAFDQLSPEYIDKKFFTDPFTSAALRYIPPADSSSRPIIYSVGPNKSDDGGEISEFGVKDDITWRYTSSNAN